MDRKTHPKSADNPNPEIILTFDLERIYQDYIEGRKTREEFLDALRARSRRARINLEEAEAVDCEHA